MKKNSIFFIFFYFFFTFPAFTQAAQGYAECKSLSDFLTRIETTTEEHAIINSDAQFPFNIVIKFNSTINTKNDRHTEDELENFILAFRTEEALQHKKLIQEILTAIKSTTRSCNVQIIFTYGDFSRLNDNYKITGTEAFLRQLAEKDKCSAVCIDLSGSANSIIPGGSQNTTPSWLTQIIANAFFESEISYKLQGNLISPLYRLNLLQNDTRASLFLEEGIPCAAIIFNTEANSNAEISTFFHSLVSLYKVEDTNQWDHHSIQFSIGNKLFWIGENFTSSLLLIISLFSIFALCELSFFVRQNERTVQQSVKTLWYLIPLTLVVTILSFLLGQGISYILDLIFTLSNYAPIIIKLFLSLFVSSFYFMALIRWKGDSIIQAASFFLPVSGIINIYLFVCIDLSLFYIFAAEYIILFLSRSIKNIYSLSVVFLLLIVPFAPYALQLVAYIRPSMIKIFVNNSLPMIVALSFAFLPFEFVWLKILMELNQIWIKTDANTKRFVKQNIIAISSAVAIFTVLLVVLTYIIPDEYRQTKTTEAPLISESDEDILKIWYKDNTFFEETSRILYVTLTEQPEACTISIVGKDGNPLIYSDAPYMYDAETHTCTFRLTAFPPLEMNFRYICNEKIPNTIYASALIYTGDTSQGKTYKRVEKRIEVSPVGEQYK
ncbi:MAG: hypothetical protein HDR56_09030 [Treponema sp.]|nr:hypothetical protein [Treponema sp.]